MRNAHLQPVFVFGKEIAQGIGKLKSQLFAQSKRDGKNRPHFGGFLRTRGGGDLKKLIYKMTAFVLLVLVLAGSVWAAPEAVIPGGSTIGLELKLDGVSIVEFSDPAPEKAGLRRGDLVQKINGTPVSSVADVVMLVERSGGRLLRLTVRRDGKEKIFKVAAKQDGGVWRLGILVRDGITGIGTVTYYDPETGTFGALGHGVNNGTSGELLPMREGTALASQVASVTRGEKGAAGALQGAIRRGGACGEILKNTSCGIFGTMPAAEGTAVPVATPAQVHTGPATILSNVEGTTVGRYAVRITAVQPADSRGRNLLLEVTDPTLLQKTGGIVQGMVRRYNRDNTAKP